jgi:predicted glycogen debranching enzyme
MSSSLPAGTSEWLEADGLGGFASGTVSGIRTRRYHALLLTATQPPVGRMVLVNGFDAEIEDAYGKFSLSTQRYAPGVDFPDGATRLGHFTVDPWPKWIYIFPGGSIVQEIFVPRGSAMVVLRWRWESSGDPPPRLTVRPFFSGRDFHSLHHENGAFRFDPEQLGHGQRWQFYDGLPPVLARTNGVYHHEPSWYRNFYYTEEAARGLDCKEDLAVPGRYEFDLSDEPAAMIFSAEGLIEPLTEQPDTADLIEQLANKEQTRRDAFPTPHHRAADAYIVVRGSGQTIIAGYPWFGDWGRDTFISMRGLCLSTGRLAEARGILTAWADLVEQGMLPNCFPDHGTEPEYNSVDASLWYVIVVHEYLEAAKRHPGFETKITKLLSAIENILAGYSFGTRYGIRADSDGLLACGEPGVQLTWMDAKIGDWVVTPRIGKPVEVQALWLTALGLASRHDPVWRATFEHGCASFHDKFWNEQRGCLYDVIDVDHEPGKVDDSIRPNQIFAVGGLPLALIEGEHAARVVQVVEELLWTPMGPRSLAPGEPNYASHYQGNPYQRDSVYHQGTVWPWLSGAFIDAWLRVHGETAENRAQARELFLKPRLASLDLAGLHHIPEIADAAPPHTERGCPFQAWSLGEFLRLQTDIL